MTDRHEHYRCLLNYPRPTKPITRLDLVSPVAYIVTPIRDTMHQKTSVSDSPDSSVHLILIPQLQLPGG